MRRELYADSAQARELDEQRSRVSPQAAELLEEELERFQREAAERRERINAANRARLKAALEELTMFFSDRK